MSVGDQLLIVERFGRLQRLPIIFLRTVQISQPVETQSGIVEPFDPVHGRAQLSRLFLRLLEI